MEIGSIGTQAAVPLQAAPRESEAAERAPDNEAAEVRAKAPLPADVGTVIDTQA